MDVAPRCKLCPRATGKPYGRTPVHGKGPAKCRVVLVGDSPGKQEATRGWPFIGDNGQELDGHYLPLAGCSRSDVFTTLVTRCPLPEFANPDDTLATCCSRRFLEDEIASQAPEVVVTLGAIAGRQFIPSLDIQRDHGIPQYVYWRGVWAGWVMPLYAPSAGLGDGAMMIHLQEDFRRLGMWLKNPAALEVPADPWEGQEVYARLRTVNELMAVWCTGAPVVTLDTEDDGEGRPLCLTFSQVEGTGYLIHRDDPEVLSRFNDLVGMIGLTGCVVLHYLLHDLEPLEALGVRLDPQALTWIRPGMGDTMVHAFHWGTAQGLKVLAWRVLRMQMQDWDDVVTLYYEAGFYAWLKGLYDSVPGDKRASNKAAVRLKLGKPGTQLKRIWTDWERQKKLEAEGRLKRKKDGTESRIDPWKRWQKIPVEGRAAIRARVVDVGHGPPPLKGLDWVPEDVLVRYACRDADATLRLYNLMKSKEWMRLAVRRLDVRE